MDSETEARVVLTSFHQANAMQVKFKDNRYEVQLDKDMLDFSMVIVVDTAGRITELLHPLDCLRLGVHNGGYFNSVQSNLVHGLKHCMGEPGIVLDFYFSSAERNALPGFYSEPLTHFGIESQNYFGVSASSSLEQWQANGWIQPSAPEGWLEAYTQYATMGIAKVDSNCTVWLPGTCGRTNWSLEQKRLLSFVARHSGQIAANCPGDLSKRRRQRQALLNWASPLAFL